MPTPSAAESALTAAQLARFRTALLALTGAKPGRIGVAVSGGADSLAMLLLADAVFPGQIEAATVDHRLRPEGAGEAAFVASICAAHGVAHTVLSVDVPGRRNVSDAARTARYTALEEWRVRRGIGWIATAHHADDQLETMVMRLNRSSGLAGLAGIRAINGHIIRPLLGWRRSELAAIVATAGIAPVCDPSNTDDRYDRARLRKLLGVNEILDPVAVARSAALLGEAEEALEAAVAILAQGIEFGDATAILRPAGLSTELQRRLVLRCLALVEPSYATRGAAVARVVAALVARRSASLGPIHAKVIRLPDGEAGWRFARGPARRAVQSDVDVPLPLTSECLSSVQKGRSDHE